MKNFTALFLLSIFFSGCQAKIDDAKVSNQRTEAKNQTAIRVSAAETAIAADSDGKILDKIEGELSAVTLDGKYIAFVRGENQKRSVWLAKLE